MLGPVQFISYSEDVVIIFNAHHVQYHIFSDNKQLFASAPVHEVHEVKKTVERCTAATKDWCAPRRLRLNDGRMEVIWLGTRGRLQQLADIGSHIIKPPTVVRDLGVFIDAELTFCEHVRRVTSSYFSICDVSGKSVSMSTARSWSSWCMLLSSVDLSTATVSWPVYR